MSEVVDQLQGSLIKMENFQKLLELKKDLIGVDNLIVPGRVSLKLDSVNTLTHVPTSMWLCSLEKNTFCTACT